MAYFSRGPNKIQNPYTLKDMYASYIVGKEDTPYFIDYNTFIIITTTYFKGVRDYLFTTGLEYKIPYKLGTWQIIKKKINFTNQHKNYAGSIDWPSTLIAGKQVFYTNDHTDGYKYLFKWNIAYARITNISKYKFTPCRAVKRHLAFIVNNKIKYYLEDK
jgi:hypothetical protein